MRETVPISLLVPQTIGPDIVGTAVLCLIGLIAALVWRIRRRATRKAGADATRGSPINMIRASFQARRIARAEKRLCADLPNGSGPAGAAAPDLDLRIAALTALEEISRMSPALDAGRSHVRVMEILCAYIRENAPASDAVPFPLADWEPLRDDATEDETSAHLAVRHVRFANRINSNARDWAASLNGPRADIALALSILGRRGPAQRAAEARCGGEGDIATSWAFDTPCPVPPDPDAPTFDIAALDRFTSDVRTWRAVMAGCRGYRPDLRDTNLQGADLSGVMLSGCRLDRARMEGATLTDARLQGAILRDARLDGAILDGVHLQGADLRRARLEGAVLRHAQMQGAVLRRARMEWANFKDARLEGADLFEARLEVASFFKAHMTGVILYRAQMDGVVLRQARLQGADLRRARLSWASAREARLDGADLSWAQMPGADLSNAVLVGAEVYKARLDSADLRKARLSGAVLAKTVLTGITSAEHACFDRARLSKVNLSGLPLAQTQIDRCLGDASVTLPTGLIRPAHWPDRLVPLLGNGGGPEEWRCRDGERHPDVGVSGSDKQDTEPALPGKPSRRTDVAR